MIGCTTTAICSIMVSSGSDERDIIMKLKVTIESDRTDTRHYSNRRASDHPRGHGICYPSFKGETLLDDFANRTSRPYNLMREPVRAALEVAGIPTGGMRWSQKAGCGMCPCSPGFILPNYTGHDVWIKVEMDEPARTNDDAAYNRAAALVTDPTMPTEIKHAVTL